MKNQYNPDLFHRTSIRLSGYDYSWNGMYFVTICSKNRECLFGEIIQNDMSAYEWLQDTNERFQGTKICAPTDIGRIILKHWAALPLYYPQIILHEFIVMPNHIHGIIELSSNSKLPLNFVGAQIFVPNISQFQKIIPNSLGTIIRAFKAWVTKWSRENTDIYEIWQRNYDERIIRDKEGFERISHYIRNNPNTWEDDALFV